MHPNEDFTCANSWHIFWNVHCNGIVPNEDWKLRGNNKTWQQKTITDESDAEPKNDQNYEKRYQKYDIHFVWRESHFIYSVN